MSINNFDSLFLRPLEWISGLTYGGVADSFLGIATNAQNFQRPDPLGTPGLFHRFAQLQTAEDILDFANEYGPLGVHRFEPTYDERQYFETIPVEHRRTLDPGERQTDWQNEAQLLGDCITLWDWIRKGDLSSLERHLGISNSMPNIWFFSPHSQRQRIIDPIDDLAYPYIDVIKRGATVLSTVIWEQMHGQTVPILEWKKSEDKTVFSMRQRAGSLRGAIWLMFAEAVAGNMTFGCCKNCSIWFQKGGGRGTGKKADAEFCKKSCWQKWKRAEQVKEKAHARIL